MKTGCNKRISFLFMGCAFLVLTFNSCKSQQNTPVGDAGNTIRKPADSLFAAIERTPCFGRCPTYVISIYQSGYVVYEGRQWVEHIGFFYTFITSKEMDEISVMAKNIDFAGLKEAYHDPNIVDVPSTFTSFRVNGKIKRIDNTFGDPPEGLVDFEKYLDGIFKNTKWISIKDAGSKD